MAITSEIIGKLGGADVEVIPVEGTASGGVGSETVIHTVTVPAEETWLVAVHGTLTGNVSTPTAKPQLTVGNVTLPGRAPDGIYGLSTVGTGSVSIKLLRNISSGSDSFTGHVYAVKL